MLCDASSYIPIQPYAGCRPFLFVMGGAVCTCGLSVCLCLPFPVSLIVLVALGRDAIRGSLQYVLRPKKWTPAVFHSTKNERTAAVIGMSKSPCWSR